MLSMEPALFRRNGSRAKILAASRELRLPDTGHRMRVASLRGGNGEFASLRGGRYFTHFEVVGVVRLAAWIMERAHTSTKKIFCVNIPNFPLDISISPRGAKNLQPLTVSCGFFPSAWIPLKPNTIIEILMHFFHPASKSTTSTTGSPPINPTKSTEITPPRKPATRTPGPVWGSL